MKRGEYISEFLVGAVIVAMTMLPVVGVAQKATPRPAPPHQAPQRPTPVPQQRVTPPAAQAPRQQRHAGDWLRQYKDLPPDEQEKALQNDPTFRNLPPRRQQILRDRLQNFSSLPPQQQLRVLNRMETWEHLTSEQKQEARQVFKGMKQLPPDRRRLVHKAIDDLRTMPTDQREQIINSDRFKGEFSDQERDLMRDATRLPLAPADSGDQPGQEPQE
jgi:uncharacterized protein DUF3106